MTTGELISAALRHYLNMGSSSVVLDTAQRQRAHFFLTRVARHVWAAAPWWYKLADSTVSLVAGDGTLPADFDQMGTQGMLFRNGQRFQQLMYLPPDRIKWLRQSEQRSGPPEAYSLYGRSAAGLPQIACYPTDTSTLDLLCYAKKMPELIDAPLAPVVAAHADVGLPTGAYTGQVTFVTASGETEGGNVSASVSVTLKKLAWTSIPLSWAKTVTARKLYRPVAGGTAHKLVATISDNTTTTYTDNVADGSLGAAVPTTGVTGLEQFPDGMHDTVLYDGLVALLSSGQADGRENDFDAKWTLAVRRAWEEYAQGRNTVFAMPAFQAPGRVKGHPMWSRFSPPQ